MTYEAFFFFSEHWKFHIGSKNLSRITQKLYGFLNNVFELATVNSLYYYENTCSLESTSYQAVLKSQILSKITLSNSFLIKIKRKLDKSTFLQISGVFRTC